MKLKPFANMTTREIIEIMMNEAESLQSTDLETFIGSTNSQHSISQKGIYTVF